MSAFREFSRGIRQEIEGELDRLLPPSDEFPTRLNQAIRYSIFAGGKRVRPALVVLSGEVFGAPRELLLSGAAAIEMIHTFSLVHDDLPALDNDDLRRGQPTVHRKFDDATAILAGDALLNLGLTTLATLPLGVEGEKRARAVSMVGEAVGSRGMIGGQVADLEAEMDWPEDAEAALDQIHRRKTGALLSASICLGGLYAGASEAELVDLRELGGAIGMMFQIGDDILDVESSTDQLGKTARKDQRARKLTYPGLHGLDSSKVKLSQIRDEALARVAALPTNGDLFPSLIHYLSDRDR